MMQKLKLKRSHEGNIKKNIKRWRHYGGGRTRKKKEDEIVKKN